MSRKFLVFMTALALGGATLVTGCGGGGGGSTPPAPSAVSVSGSVVDGYIAGADILVDGVAVDSSDGTGKYTVSVTPGAVITAIGGTDQTTGSPFTGTLVTKYEAADDKTKLHITPLTTLYVYAPEAVPAGLGNVKIVDIGADTTDAAVKTARKAALAVQSIVATIKSATGLSGLTTTSKASEVAFKAVGEVLKTRPLINTATGVTATFDSVDVLSIANNVALFAAQVANVSTANSALVKAKVEAATSVIESVTNQISTIQVDSVDQRDIENIRGGFAAELDSIEKAATTQEAAVIKEQVQTRVDSKEAVAPVNRARAKASQDSFEAVTFGGYTLALDFNSVRESVEAKLNSIDPVDIAEFDAIFAGANYLPRLVGAIPAQNLTVGQAMSSVDLATYFKDNGTLTYAVSTGSLPSGVALTAGVISGTPTTAAAAATVVVTATDASSKAASGSVVFTVQAAGVDTPDTTPIDPADCAVDYPPVQGLPSDFYPPKVVEACYPDNLFPPTPGL